MMADSLYAPDAGIGTKIASVAVPVLAGVGAAATPGGARGINALSNMVGLQSTLREQARNQEAERQLGGRLSSLLDTAVTPGRTVPAPPEAAMYSEQDTQQVPGQRLSDMLGAPRTELIKSMLSVPRFAPAGATMLSSALEPRTPVKVGAEESLIDPRTNQVVYQSQPKRQPHVVEVFDPTRGRNIRRVVDLNQMPSGTELGEMPPNPANFVVEELDTAQGPQKVVVDKTTMQRWPLGTATETGHIMTRVGPDGKPENVMIGMKTGREIKALGPTYEKPERGIITEETGPTGPRQMLRDPITGEPRATLPGKPMQIGEATINSIRGQFEQQSKDFGQVRDAFAKIDRAATGTSSPAGDLNLIYGYMKLLDPQSVVREGEFATAQNSRAPAPIQRLYNAVVSGERLTPEQRQDFYGRARDIAQSQLQIHEQREQEYRRISTASGLDPNAVVPDMLGADLRARMRGTVGAGRAGTQADIEQALRDTRGDKAKAINLLRQRGINPDLDVAR